MGFGSFFSRLTGKVTGSTGVARAGAAAADSFQPFTINAGGLGSIDSSERGAITLGSSSLADQFRNPLGLAALQFIQNAQGGDQLGGASQEARTGLQRALQGAGAGLGRANSFANSAGQGLGALFGRAGAAGLENLQASRQAREALGNFDPDAFATQQFDRLNRLAAPGEATQTSSALTNLFARGRLGEEDSVTGEVGRQLDLGQRLARDERLGQALGLANQEQNRLFSQASGFGNLGLQGLGQASNIQGQQFGQQFGALQNLQALQQFVTGQQRQTALDRFGIAQQALQGNQQFQQGQFGLGLAGIAGINQTFQPTLDLANLSIAAGQGRSEARVAGAGLQAEAAGREGDFFSGLVGGALGGLFSDARLKEDLKVIGMVPVYRWKWNEEGQRLAAGQPAVGVLAQDLEQVAPELVRTDASGYKKVFI